MMWTELRRMTHEGEECCCHSRPPCDWCSAMTEQELDAWGADGMDGLNALWSAMDELEPVLDAATARAEAAEARAAQAEAAGYRRAVDDACAALSKRAGYLRNFDLAGEIVCALAPVEPVSPADKLPGGAA